MQTLYALLLVKVDKRLVPRPEIYCANRTPESQQAIGDNNVRQSRIRGITQSIQSYV